MSQRGMYSHWPEVRKCSSHVSVHQMKCDFLCEVWCTDLKFPDNKSVFSIKLWEKHGQ